MIINGNTNSDVVINGNAPASGAMFCPMTMNPFTDPRTTGWYYCYVNISQGITSYLSYITSRDNLLIDLIWKSQDIYQVAGIDDFDDLRNWVETHAPQLDWGLYAGTEFTATRAVQDANRSNSDAVYNVQPRLDNYWPYVPKEDFPAAAITGASSTYPVALPNSFFVDPSNSDAQKIIAAAHVRYCLANGVNHCLTDEMSAASTHLSLLIRMSQAFRSAGLRYVPNLGPQGSWLTSDAICGKIGMHCDAVTFESCSPSVSADDAFGIPTGSQQELIDYIRRMELIVSGGCMPIYLPVTVSTDELVNIEMPFHNALAIMLGRCLVARAEYLAAPVSSDWADRLGSRTGPISVSASRIITCEFLHGMLSINAATRDVELST